MFSAPVVPHYESTLVDPWYNRLPNRLARQGGTNLENALFDPSRSMPITNMVAFRKRTRFGRPILRNRFTRRRRFVPFKRFNRKRGGWRHQRRYKRINFVGHNRMRLRNLQNCIETKVSQFAQFGNTTVAHGTTGVFQWLFWPMVNMVQGTGSQNFNGNCMWVRGISLRMHWGNMASASNIHMHFRVYKTNFKVASASFTQWGELAATGQPGAAGTNTTLTAANLNFLDPPAPASQIIAWGARANPRGPKLLMQRRIRLPASQNTATNEINTVQSKEVKLWIPMNQVWKWEDDPLDDTGIFLQSAPNHGVYGDIVVVLTYEDDFNLNGAGAVTPVLHYWIARIHYKDP